MVGSPRWAVHKAQRPAFGSAVTTHTAAIQGRAREKTNENRYQKMHEKKNTCNKLNKDDNSKSDDKRRQVFFNFQV